MKNYLCTLLLASAGIAVSMPHAIAQDASAPEKKTIKKTAVKKSKAKPAAKKSAAAVPAANPEDDMAPDIASSTTVDYQCELGNKVTIYENNTDSQHVGLRWNKKLHRLTRVSTTTGASRFENKKYGLVWIGIPAKGILLDSKKGQQLANECKNAGQMMPKQEELTVKAPETAAPAQTQIFAEPTPAPSPDPTNLASQ